MHSLFALSYESAAWDGNYTTFCNTLADVLEFYNDNYFLNNPNNDHGPNLEG